MLVFVPVSVGELIDKITILRIKMNRLDASKRVNVQKELGMLEKILGEAIVDLDLIRETTGLLTEVNSILWDIEEKKRDCERREDFGAAYIDLARLVCLENDRRSAIKRHVNLLSKSEIVEEKSHPGA